ncbi:hypothetical protein BGW80DRAFT_1555998 [Lactifluus volemus]|nr:hypothetical protein BGW80DRAFT_1555998 [Lactifluus volemus]
MSLAKDGTDLYQNWTLASTFFVIIAVAVATSLWATPPFPHFHTTHTYIYTVLAETRAPHGAERGRAPSLALLVPCFGLYLNPGCSGHWATGALSSPQHVSPSLGGRGRGRSNVPAHVEPQLGHQEPHVEDPVASVKEAGDGAAWPASSRSLPQRQVIVTSQMHDHASKTNDRAGQRRCPFMRLPRPVRNVSVHHLSEAVNAMGLLTTFNATLFMVVLQPAQRQLIVRRIRNPQQRVCPRGPTRADP